MYYLQNYKQNTRKTRANLSHREKYLFDSNKFCLNQTYFILDIRSNKCLFDLNILFVCLNLFDFSI